MLTQQLSILCMEGIDKDHFCMIGRCGDLADRICKRCVDL